MARKTYKVDNVLPLNWYGNTKVIIYNDEDIKYIIGNGTSFEWEPKCMTYESIDGKKTSFPMGAIVNLHVDDANCLDNIKLDDTLMRRIAIFNKEQECKRLDEEIADKKKQIKEIETILEDREHRLEKLKKFIAHIYEIDIEDDDDWD